MSKEEDRKFIMGVVVALLIIMILIFSGITDNKSEAYNNGTDNNSNNYTDSNNNKVTNQNNYDEYSIDSGD